MSQNPSAMYTRRRSRNGRRCERCNAKVARGDHYTRASLPPWKDPNSSPKWWTLNLCEVCAPPQQGESDG